MANLTDADLISIRQLPAAIALQGTDVIPLGQLVNGANTDSGGTVDQLVAFLSGLFNGIAVDFGPDRTAIASSEDGDIFFDTDDGIIYKYESGAWAAKLDFVTGAELASAIAGFLTQTQGDSRYALQSALSESIDDRVAALLVAGANTAIAYDDATNTLTLSVPNEGIDDRVAALLTAGSNISLSYNDATNTLTIASTVSGGGASGIQYTYSDQDPPTTSGQIRTLQADLSAATAIAIHPTDAQGNLSNDVFQRLKAGAIISIAKDGSNWIRATVSVDYSNGSVGVGSVVSEGAIAVDNTVFLSIVSDAPSATTGADVVADLPFASVINPDLNQGKIFMITATGNFTLGAPQNASIGQQWELYVTQDSAGNRTLTLPVGTSYEPEGGSLSLTGTPNTYDILKFRYFANYPNSTIPRISAYFAAKNLLQGTPPIPPVITSPLSAVGTAGVPFSYTIAANNNPASFNATGLPANLSINASTGVISGTPATSGSSNISISATNAAGTDTETLALTVNSASRPSTKNTLTYTPSDGESGYTFFQTYNLSLINDGSLTNGPVKTTGGTESEMHCLVTFAAETFLNEITVTTGRFNGRYSNPDKIFIYRGNSTAGPLLLNPATSNLTGPYNDGGSPLPTTTIDLIGNANFDIPSTQYLIVFRKAEADAQVSVAELVLKG